MRLSINAVALLVTVTAFSSHRAPLPAVVRRPNTQPDLSMRYGKKQVKIRQWVNRRLDEASEIDAVAEVLASDEVLLANRRMSVHLIHKIRKKAALMGYDLGYIDEDDEKLMDDLEAAGVDMSQPVDMDAVKTDAASADAAPAEAAAAV